MLPKVCMTLRFDVKACLVGTCPKQALNKLFKKVAMGWGGRIPISIKTI